MKKEQGITLIALVITIIVLLILAGVTIATLTGDNGLLTKAAKAKESVKDGEIGEQIKLACQEYKLGQYTGESGDLYNFIQGKMEDLCGANNYTLTRMGRNIKIETAGRNKYYILKYDGTVNEYDKIEKIAATDEMYGYLDEENEILYLRATPKTDYLQLTKHSSMKSFIVNNNFDTSKIKTINIEEPVAPISGYFMFQSCTKLESIENIENLHTENMTNMMAMFHSCNSLSSIDLSGFDTSKVTIMHYMFYGCSKLQNINLELFDTRNVFNMAYMFMSCASLKELDLSSFNTSKVTAMNHMFYGCLKVTKIDLSSFNTSLCTSLNMMFPLCSNLEELDISNFNINPTANMTEMFRSSNKLKRLNLGRNFIITEGNNIDKILNGVPSDIKITAIQDTANKLIDASSLTLNNFEIIN